MHLTFLPVLLMLPAVGGGVAGLQVQLVDPYPLTLPDLGLHFLTIPLNIRFTGAAWAGDFQNSI